MKKILITGATGFIGKNLAETLQKTYEVLSPNRRELNLLDQESVENYLKSNNFDIVIHAANTNNTRNKKTTDFEALDGNLRMFFNLERCNAYYERMYYFGSGAEYDRRHYVPFMKEEYFNTYIPEDPYGFSKYIMSAVSEKSSNIYDLRLFGVYGKYEEWERRFISNAICRALTGRSITIQQNVFFDYLWIDDLSKIVTWFIEHIPVYKQYNVCRGKSIDLYSLACIVKEVLNTDCDIIVGNEGLKPEYTGDNNRLLNELGDFTFSGMHTTICDLSEYYQNHMDVIQEELL